MRRWLAWLVVGAVAAPAAADVPPSGSVQVFFDGSMQTNAAVVHDFGVGFTVLAYDLPGDVAEYRFRLEFSGDADDFMISFPEHVTNVGYGADYVLWVDGTCLEGDGVVVLAQGAVIGVAGRYDVTLCLGPTEDPGLGAGVLGYRRCDTGAWEEMSLLYPGCAVINPWHVTPAPIENNDPNAVVFACGSAAGEPHETVVVPVDLAADLRKGGDPSLIGRIEFGLAWDPLVATFADLALDVPADWDVVVTPAPGSLSVAAAGATSLAPSFGGDLLAEVTFELAGAESESPLALTVDRLVDRNALPIDRVLPAPGVLAVTCEKGDVIDSPHIDALDAVMALEFAVGRRVPDDREFCRADMNRNLRIHARDAAAILTRAVGGKAGPAAGSAIHIASTDDALRLETGDAAGIDLLVRWDPERAELTGWAGRGGDLHAEDRRPGHLRLALARGEGGADGVIELRFAGDDVAVDVERIETWAADGAAVSARSDVRVVLGRGALPRPVLHAPAPNPFNPVTRLAWDMPAPGWAEVRILDLRGRRVWQRRVAAYAGRNAMEWRGCDTRGRSLASGNYLVVLETADGIETARLALVR